MIAPAQCDISAMPGTTRTLFEKINERMPVGEKFNHGIFTLYADSKDSIDHHSDKINTFKDGSWFLVIKLGNSRNFQFKDKKSGKLLFDEELPAGTAIVVKSDTANRQTTHGVLQGASESGSIVLRQIKMRKKWADIEKQITKAMNSRTANLRKKKFEARRKEIELQLRKICPNEESPPADSESKEESEGGTPKIDEGRQRGQGQSRGGSKKCT